MFYLIILKYILTFIYTDSIGTSFKEIHSKIYYISDEYNIKIRIKRIYFLSYIFSISLIDLLLNIFLFNSKIYIIIKTITSNIHYGTIQLISMLFLDVIIFNLLDVNNYFYLIIFLDSMLTTRTFYNMLYISKQ